MWDSVVRFFTPPKIEDPGLDRQARTLHQILLVALAVVLISMGIAPIFSPSPVRSALLNLSFCVPMLVTMWIVRRGHLGLATIVLSTSIWLGLTGTAVAIVGVNSSILAAYISGAVLVGFFSGGRVVVSYSVLTAGFLFAAAWAESHGRLPEPSGAMTPYMSWVAISAGLAITSMLIVLSRRNDRIAIEGLQRGEREAVEFSHQLEASSELLGTRARQQATIAELGQLALADTPPGELIAIAVKAVEHTLEVDIVTVFESIHDGGSFILRGGAGWDASMVDRVTIPVERATQAGHTLLANEPVIVADWHDESRFPRPAGFEERGIISSVSVVIHGTDAPYGVFGVHAASQRDFSDDDVHFLQSVANLLTLMMRRTAMDAALKESEEHLRQAQKMEAIGRFAGGIAHDFNNMLTAISGYNEMVMRQFEPGDPGRADTEEIEHAARRAAALVQQILAFSRRQVLRPEIVDLNEIIEKTKGMLERIIGEDIALSIVLAPDLCSVRADPGQIEQVLLNLAANARDAMPRGGKLTVETSNEMVEPGRNSTTNLAPGQYVKLVVRDTGVGISDEIRERIFEPFFTTKSLSEGTGLGLSTVYGIVHQSGGEITVSSEPSSWTRFDIHLPRSSEDKLTLEAPDRPRMLHGGGETVLLVEDEPRVRRLTRRMLEGMGYVVIEAENGIAALEIAERRQEALPLLITDVIMPELGGGDLVERLTTSHPETRVLYVSGYADDVLGHERLRRERAAFLPKPFGQKELAEKLQELFES